MTFGDKLQKLRKCKGLSQEQLADKLEVSRQAISKWELGDTMPELNKIVAIANFFDVTTDYLINEKEDVEKPVEEKNRSEFYNNNQNNSHKQSFSYFKNLVKRKGYLAGYVISAYFASGLLISRLAHFMFSKMAKISGNSMGSGLPSGWDTNLPSGWEGNVSGITGGIESQISEMSSIPIMFTNMLSIIMLLGVIGGIVLALYLKKHSEK